MLNKLLIIIILSTMVLKGQNIVSPYGSSSLHGSGFSLSTLESNPAIGNSIKDWELSFVFSSLYENSKIASNIQKISLGKRTGNHSIYFRYMPEMKKEFIIDPGINVNIGDEETFSLKKYQTYKEDFGFSYGYSFDETINVGISLRHMKNKYSEEILSRFFNPDSSTYYYLPELSTKETDVWIGDLGFNLFFSESFQLNISSYNLYKDFSESNYSPYKLNLKKSVKISSNYSPYSNSSINVTYSSDNSYSFGISYGLKSSIGNFIAGCSYFNQKSAEKITGIVPSLTFRNEFISLTFSGIKYFGKNNNLSITDFEMEGLKDFYINKYENDKAFFSVNMALSFKKKQSVKISDIEVLGPIYPSLDNEYLFRPFAKGKIRNLTDKVISIRTATQIDDINSNKILSNQYNLKPKDTLTVDFFITVENNKIFKKHKISEAKFFILTDNNEPEDYLIKPVLINSSNSWNGKIRDLKYFIDRDFKYASEYAKSILSSNKEEITSGIPELETLKKIKIIYNSVASQFLYVSDPRAASEYVQFPSETLKLKGGDCDDLSVCFAALFDGVGINTAFIDYKNIDDISHVSLLVDTGVKAENADIITGNDKKIFIRNSGNGNTVWLPIETTVLTNFEESWNSGSEKFFNEAIRDMGLAKKNVRIIDIR